MVTTHSLGFPRIGNNRELKFALESFWQGQTTERDLAQVGRTIRNQNWRTQSRLDFVPTGDFSFYDQILDTSFALGNIPSRTIIDGESSSIDQYFRAARGNSGQHSSCQGTHAGEMTKWLDTNYHYIVPEFTQGQTFALNAETIINHVKQARIEGHRVKPVIVGPVSYLWLGKLKNGDNSSNTDEKKLALLDNLLECYDELIDELAALKVEWLQIDEPILVTEIDASWKRALDTSYHRLNSKRINILLTTYFGRLAENLQFTCALPVQGLHIDATRAKDEITRIIDWLPNYKVLSLGVVDGRNIWKNDIAATLDWLEPIHEKLAERLWLAPSCSLLHVPMDVSSEYNNSNDANKNSPLPEDVRDWLAFAVQKIEELDLIAKALNDGRTSVKTALAENAASIRRRRTSIKVNNEKVQQRLSTAKKEDAQRRSVFQKRTALQQQKLSLPLFPTTTIGSFPQTQEIRKTRREYKQGLISGEHYRATMKTEIAHVIAVQEQLGIDVLVHGEPERNDMVEYFGEHLDGYAFTGSAWVQSYGSRCVKPPILYGDVSRPATITRDWIEFAQSLTTAPVKAMLTGPVTMLNWSFVRDDQPRSASCLQLALALRDEVLDLESNGTQIIQIDEAALREGLPLRKSDWRAYLDWAIYAFRLTANGVEDGTQIHTHMCYSEFNDIIADIAAMDADVITIETSRSDMKLLDIFEHFRYPNSIGPGVYDIHSPNIPEVKSIVALMQRAAERIPRPRLWVNPDCGLKTRGWKEVTPALERMVRAAKILREENQREEELTKTNAQNQAVNTNSRDSRTELV